METKPDANLRLDVDRARAIAAKLQEAYRTTGIFGNKATAVATLPQGMIPGSEEHLRFVTLTAAMDYQRDVDHLWSAARRTYADPETRYLFDPVRAATTAPLKVVANLQRYHLSRRREVDAQTWQRICITLTHRFEGEVRVLIDFARRDAVRLLELIRSNIYSAGFPYLKGAKLGPRWVHMLHDNCRVPLERLAEVPLHVDMDVAQATLQVGAVQTGPWQGKMAELRVAVQQVWREALSDPGTGAYALRVAEPLWILSTRGCRVTRKWPCEFRARCPVAAECQAKQVWLHIGGQSNNDESECSITPR